MTIMAGMKDLKDVEVVGINVQNGRLYAMCREDGKEVVKEFVQYITPAGVVRVRPYEPDTRVDQQMSPEERTARRWRGIDQL